MNGLVRRHELIRALPKTVGAAMATATIALNLLVFEVLRGRDWLGLDRGSLFEMMILIGGLYLLAMNETGRRSSRWAQALPVDARTLWTGHVHALFVASSLVVLAMAAVVMIFASLIERFDPLEFLGPGTVVVRFVRPWLVMLAVSLVLGAWRPRLADPHRAAGWNRIRLGVALGAVLVLTILQYLPLVVGIFPVIAAGLWVRRARGDLPPVLELADQPGAGPVADSATVPRLGGWIRHWLILRQLFKWPLSWIIGIPMTFLLGLVMGGAFSVSSDADFARYFNAWITAYLMIAFVGHFLENLHRVEHLPVGRGLLLRWLVLPNLVALLAGGLLGTTLDARRPVGESLGFENDFTRPHPGLQVPVDLWRPVWGDPPATVTAPWGETGPVASTPVVAGLPLHLWKPYTTSSEASPEFVAWQISRAITDAYGLKVGTDLITDRYLVTGPDGTVRVREEGLTPVGDFMGDGRRSIGPILGLLLGFTVNLALATFAVVFSLCGPGATARRIKVVFWTAMGILMLGHLGGYALLMGRLVVDWKVTALVEGLAGRLGAWGSGGWILPWAAGAILALLLWRVCSRAFARVEAVRGGSSRCI